MKSSLEPGPRRPRRYRYTQLLTVLAVLAISACTGVVVSPINEFTANGRTEFWGYAITPQMTINLEAQTTAGSWVAVATTTSSSVPTYTGSHTGYLYSVWYDPSTLGATYRRPSPSGASWRRVFLRIKAPEANPAETRGSAPTSPVPSGPTLESMWQAYRASDQIIRVDVRN